MKKLLTYMLAISLVFTLVGCGSGNSKEDIFNLVETNYDAILNACEEQDEAALLAIDGIKNVNIVEDYIIVYCEGAGIAPSSQDYGFYYSAENSPVAVDCNQDIIRNADALTPDGAGFTCVVNYNTFYTEHIKGNLYFYSNSY